MGIQSCRDNTLIKHTPSPTHTPILTHTLSLCLVRSFSLTHTYAQVSVNGKNVEGMRAKEVISDLCICIHMCIYKYVFIYIYIYVCIYSKC